MVRLDYDLYLVMLELDLMTYDEYVKSVPAYERPKEYETYALFLKNKGKATKRMQKEAEWRDEGIKKGIIPEHWQ